MTIVRLINTSTALPVDETLEKAFFRIVDPAFMRTIKKQRREAYVDVLLVDRDDLPSDDSMRRDGIPDTDLLGIYVPHDQYSHRPMIKVSPERVLDACQPWNQKMGDVLPFAERYPALLYAVIIHELAHFLMDDRTLFDKYCRARSWTENIRWLEDNAANKTNGEWANEPVPDSDCEKWVHKKLKSLRHRCDVKMQSIENWTNKHSTVALPLQEQCKMVEESLANAFALKQTFGNRHLEALRVFINSQSKPYKTGLKWHGDLRQLLGMASIWRRFKSDSIGISGQECIKASSNQREWLKQLIKYLGNPEGVVLPLNFQCGAIGASMDV
jgi:hypothetical protein